MLSKVLPTGARNTIPVLRWQYLGQPTQRLIFVQENRLAVMHLLHPGACRRGQYREAVELLRLPVFIAALPTIPQTGQQQTRAFSTLQQITCLCPCRRAHS